MGNGKTMRRRDDHYLPLPTFTREKISLAARPRTMATIKIMVTSTPKVVGHVRRSSCMYSVLLLSSFNQNWNV